MTDQTINIPSELLPQDGRFGCGPSRVDNDALRKLADEVILGTSHRKPAVKNLVKRITAGMKEFFNIPEDYLFGYGNGGATQVFEMAALNLVRKSSVDFVSGEFSNKWYSFTSKVPGIEAKKIASDFGSSPKIEYQETYDFHCTTLCETSTGVMVPSIPKLPEDTLLAVDATSGAGCINVDLNKIDLFFFSPQKAFGSEGGLYLFFLSPNGKKRLDEIAQSDRYIPTMMNMQSALDNGAKDQTYNTPAISTLYLLAHQIEKLNHLGSAQVYEECSKKAAFLYKWAEKEAFASPFVTDTKLRSTAVATIDLDDNLPSDWLCAQLRANGILDTEAYRKLGRNQIRIALFPNVPLSDLEKLCESISYLASRFEG